MDYNFYKGRRVLVTGHTGFKGSWLTLMLHRIGAEVTGVALEPITPDDHYVASDIGRLCDSHLFDLADADRLAQLVARVKPSTVFHLAAQPLVRHSYREPLETFRTNVMGTAHLLEAVRRSGHPCTVVIITTDKVYENAETPVPYRESDRLGGRDPYSASKAAAEMVAGSYRNSFFHPDRYHEHGVAVATARAGNVIGGGDWSADRLLPDLVRAWVDGREAVIRNPEAVRPWQHVLDPLFGYLLLGERLYEEPGQFGSAWNFGPGREGNLTVRELAGQAAQAYGSGTFRTENLKNAPHEATLLRLDISKAKKELGWVPTLTTPEAICWTMEWYAAYRRNTGSMAGLSENQVERFLHKTNP